MNEIKARDLFPFWEQIFKQRPVDALPPDYRDLEYLFDYVYPRVQDGRISSILEFGSGCSTRVLFDIRILSRKIYSLTSLENDIEWYEINEEWLFNKSIIEFCPIERKLINNQWTFRYTNRPIGMIDFIYLDGPELTDQIRITSDPLDYEPFFTKNFSMIIDGRHETVQFLSQNFKKKYKITPIEGIDSTLFELLRND